MSSDKKTPAVPEEEVAVPEQASTEAKSPNSVIASGARQSSQEATPPAQDDAPAAVRHDFKDGTRIDITIEGQSYPVFLIDEPATILGEYIAEQSSAKNVALIGDEHTMDLFGLRYEPAFISAGLTVVALTVSAGEETKNWNIAGQLVSVLSNSGIERKDAIVALGGGMVSDLSGFVASIYQRGVDFYLIPTTLLALVDAAIGGKVAVNREEAKNLAGAFKQPGAIAADLRVLAKLPEDQYRSGLAELAKTAILSGEDFLSYLEQHTAELNERDPEVLREVVARAMIFKAQIVAKDPYDRGLRACLNYGHTIGHALEQVSDFTLPHGIAVAEGMRFAARLSVQLYGASLDFVRRQDALLDALGLVALEVGDYSMADLRDAMQRDKKNYGGEITFVLVQEPGVVGTAPVDTTVLYSHLRPWLGIKAYEPPAEPEPEPEPDPEPGSGPTTPAIASVAEAEAKQSSQPATTPDSDDPSTPVIANEGEAGARQSSQAATSSDYEGGEA